MFANVLLKSGLQFGVMRMMVDRRPNLDCDGGVRGVKTDPARGVMLQIQLRQSLYREDTKFKVVHAPEH